MIDIQCANCGKWFSPKKRKQTNCSNACYTSSWRKTHPEGWRQIQERFFQRNPDKQREYSQRRKKQKTIIPCQGCGTLFEAYHGRKLFCTAVCQRKTYQKNNRLLRIEQHRTWVANNRERMRTLTLRYLHKKINNYPWQTLIESTRKRAAKNGVEHTLTFDWGKQHWTGKCAITGIPFTEPNNRRGRKNRTFFPSIDRINPHIGYTPENSRFVLWAVNAFKSDGTEEDMLMIAKAIVDSISPVGINSSPNPDTVAISEHHLLVQI